MAGYRTAQSDALYLDAQRVIAGGVNSGACGPQAGWIPGPPVVHHGAGAYLWDVDGQQHIDCLLHGACGDVPPAEFEVAYHQHLRAATEAA